MPASMGLSAEKEKEHQGQRERPAAGPGPAAACAPARGICVQERAVMLGGQEHPGDGQVGGRVAGCDVSEVDHPGETAAVHQDVGGMQVPVQP
jgi:hypothetical protein